MNLALTFQLLVLVAVANGAPIMAKKTLGAAFAWRLDGGSLFADGRPIFGAAKTLRGVVAAICATSLAALLIGLPIVSGVAIAVGAMIGDLLSSFIKRRLDMPVSTPAPFLDQAPEALVAMICARLFLDINLAETLVVVIGFFIGQLTLSRLFYAWGLRDRPL